MFDNQFLLFDPVYVDRSAGVLVLLSKILLLVLDSVETEVELVDVVLERGDLALIVLLFDFEIFSVLFLTLP